VAIGGFMTKLLVASTNPDKLVEIRTILDDARVDVEVISLASWPDLAAPDETGATFAENARAKARYYAAATGLLTVAEDSGLEIDALDGRPGVLSARFGGVSSTYAQKFSLIYRMLADRGAATSAARFVCALALARGREVVFETRGMVEGSIAPAPRGENGFGYDPIFFYPPFGRTLAEVPRARKAEVGHRGQAFRQLRGFLGRE
jgi:XTP/dITP diphosphohydrolase